MVLGVIVVSFFVEPVYKLAIRTNVRITEFFEPIFKLISFEAPEFLVKERNDNILDVAEVSHNKHGVVPAAMFIYPYWFFKLEHVAHGSDELLVSYMHFQAKGGVLILANTSGLRSRVEIKCSLADYQPPHKLRA